MVPFVLIAKRGKLHKIEFMMEVNKISLDMRDSTRLSRFFQVIFGLFCIASSAWFLLNLIKTNTASGTNIIAVAFLFFFGVWLLLSAAEVTGRYIIISDEKIILKDKYIPGPRTFAPGNLKTVVFKPLSFELQEQDGSKTLVKLGLYYRERSANILELIEAFCKTNSINIEGLTDENK